MRFMIIVKASKESEAGVMPSEKLLAEMQTALLFFNQPLGSQQMAPVSTCPATLAIEDAVRLMEERQTDVLLVRDESGKD